MMNPMDPLGANREPKFKRCKISRQQLSILTQFFDKNPLPTFDKRNALAKQLGMTPRSVQIWFQNRRQRLLKPGATMGGVDDDMMDEGEATPSLATTRPTGESTPQKRAPAAAPPAKATGAYSSPSAPEPLPRSAQQAPTQWNWAAPTQPYHYEMAAQQGPQPQQPGGQPGTAYGHPPAVPLPMPPQLPPQQQAPPPPTPQQQQQPPPPHPQQPPPSTAANAPPAYHHPAPMHAPPPGPALPQPMGYPGYPPQPPPQHTPAPAPAPLGIPLQHVPNVPMAPPPAHSSDYPPPLAQEASFPPPPPPPIPMPPHALQPPLPPPLPQSQPVAHLPPHQPLPRLPYASAPAAAAMPPPLAITAPPGWPMPHTDACGSATAAPQPICAPAETNAMAAKHLAAAAAEKKSLPTLVSRLSSLMMGTSPSPDLTLGGLPHALQMLPQAVATGHLSAGAATLLMEALQAQMSHLEEMAGGGSSQTSGGSDAAKPAAELPSPTSTPDALLMQVAQSFMASPAPLESPSSFTQSGGGGGGSFGSTPRGVSAF